ncbi:MULTISPECIES: hypothetical protein [unclassified Streptomyces]|jgi:hypothetical protein|uniref:hypothetical protein n=1 Tax=unclassified Streptomyces TaxID=2593676 RepID=UPI00081AFCED|nr:MULTISPECIES: hypothetical protein [unclassified Streptomyces]MYQ85665.1 hypothetical protein [Streptomyces sp. SID4936]SCE08588.1 hypothetical protein GA0115234_1056435 [Streptomyces sp. DvalAA-43]
MRTRTLRFGLYADEQGLAWARRLVEEAVGCRSARIVRETVGHTVFGGGMTTAYAYDFLVEQWAWEHPGESSGAREPVELCVRLECSLKTWRAIRKAVIRDLCPEGMAPHLCRVPWTVT